MYYVTLEFTEALRLTSINILPIERVESMTIILCNAFLLHWELSRRLCRQHHQCETCVH